MKDQEEEQLDAISYQKRVSIGDKNCVKNISIFETIAKVSKSKNGKDGMHKMESKIEELKKYNPRIQESKDL